MNPLADLGTPFIAGRAVALSAADVGARAPSWNDETGFGTDLARALPQCSAHRRLRSRVPLGRDERLVGPGSVPLPDAMEAVDRMAFVGGRKAQGRETTS
ncbi:MAG TPA: hypothetical protein VF043_11430 [Ktedonobacteraceae bacterium]